MGPPITPKPRNATRVGLLEEYVLLLTEGVAVIGFCGEKLQDGKLVSTSEGASYTRTLAAKLNP